MTVVSRVAETVSRVARALTVSAVCLLGLTLSEARAQVVWDNGSGAVAGGSGTNITAVATADDFQFTQTTVVTGIRFWFITDFGGSATDFSGKISWFFHENATDRPGAPLGPEFQGTTSLVTQTLTGVISETGAETVQVDFSIPTTEFVPGTYWIRLKENGPEDPADDTTIYWADTAGVQLNQLREDDSLLTPTTWPNTFNADAGFVLLGRTVTVAAPEPCSLGLLALVGTAFVRRPRK